MPGTFSLFQQTKPSPKPPTHACNNQPIAHTANAIAVAKTHGNPAQVDPLGLACEGRFLIWVAEDDAERTVAALKNTPGGENAAVIGHVEEAAEGSAPVVLAAKSGGIRLLDLLSGADLPRIF